MISICMVPEKKNRSFSFWGGGVAQVIRLALRMSVRISTHSVQHVRYRQGDHLKLFTRSATKLVKFFNLISCFIFVPQGTFRSSLKKRTKKNLCFPRLKLSMS